MYQHLIINHLLYFNIIAQFWVMFAFIWYQSKVEGRLLGLSKYKHLLRQQNP